MSGGEILISLGHATGCGSRDFFTLRPLDFIREKDRLEGTGIFQFLYESNNECEAGTTSTLRYHLDDIRWVFAPSGVVAYDSDLQFRGRDSCHYSFSLADGGSVKNGSICDLIRQRYDGQWRGSMGGEVRGETLKDGSVLVEVSDRLAEYFFYHLPYAKEEIVYVPKKDGSGNLNYFNRTSDSIACGFWSWDLEKDPFPSFKCRFRVDPEGTLHAFTDRSKETSSSKPFLEEWEDGLLDFYFRKVDSIVSPIAGAYNDSLSKDEGDKFDFQFYGPLAQKLFDLLKAETISSSWGPDIKVKTKNGAQLWCLISSQPDNFSTDPNQKVKCRLTFDSSGRASDLKQ